MIDECGFSFRGWISILINCKTHWKILFLPFCVPCRQVDIRDFFWRWIEAKGWTLFDGIFKALLWRNINQSRISYFLQKTTLFKNTRAVFFRFVIIFKVSSASTVTMPLLYYSSSYSASTQSFYATEPHFTFIYNIEIVIYYDHVQNLIVLWTPLWERSIAAYFLYWQKWIDEEKWE